MIWSRYNIFFQKEGKNFLYNSLSNCFVELESKDYSELKEYFESDRYPESDSEIIDDLREIKAIDVDEETELLRIQYKETAARFNPTVLGLTINPTLSCNFRCPYCFEKDHPIKFMTDEVEDAIIDYVKKSNLAKVISVTWFGGEPLLAFDRVKSLSKRLMALDKKYDAGMITNGYLLTENIASQFADLRITHIQITVDGLRETHDSRRFLAGGGPTFDRILGNIIKCQEVAPKTRIALRVNIDPSNKDEFMTVWRLIDSYNLPNIHVYPGFVIKDVDSEHKDCSICSQNERYRFLKDLYKDENLKYMNFYPSGKYLTCTADSVSKMVIGPEGELYKCWNDVGNPGKIFGNIFDSITVPKNYYRYLSNLSVFDNEECRACVLLPVCNGGCPNERLMNKYEGKQINTCPIRKENIEEMLYLHFLDKNNYK